MKYLLSLGVAVLLLMGSCKKDSKQILASWQVEKVTIGGVDKTADYTKNNYTETYADGGVYSFSGDPSGNSGSGKYTWDGKSTIKRSGVSNQSSMDLTVTRLTNDEFEYKTTISGDEAEFKFNKK